MGHTVPQGYASPGAGVVMGLYSPHRITASPHPWQRKVVVDSGTDGEQGCTQSPGSMR